MVELPNHRVEAQLGVGSTATVYRATDASGRVVAVKLFRLDYRRVWMREVSVALTLDHPHLLTALDVVHLSSGRCAIVYPLMVGSVGDQLSAGRTFNAHDVRVLLRDLLEGLAALHDAGLVHGDIKPDNVLVNSSGRYLVGDLGLCTTPGKLTSVGGEGTPAYVAPERIYDEAVPSSDLYSVGVMAWELLVGELPFEGAPADVFRAHLQQVPHFEALAQSTLRPLIEQLLDKDPNTRVASARVALDILNRVSDATPGVAERLVHIKPLTQEPSAPPLGCPTDLERVFAVDVRESVASVLPRSVGRRPVLAIDHGTHFELRTSEGLTTRSLVPHAGTWGPAGSDGVVFASGGALWWLGAARGERRRLVAGCGRPLAACAGPEGTRWLWADRRRQVLGVADDRQVTVPVAHGAFQPHVALLEQGWVHADGPAHDLLTRRDEAGRVVDTLRVDGVVMWLGARRNRIVAVVARIDRPGWTVWSWAEDPPEVFRPPADTRRIAAAGDFAVWIDADDRAVGVWPGQAPTTLGSVGPDIESLAVSEDRRFLATLGSGPLGREAVLWRLS